MKRGQSAPLAIPGFIIITEKWISDFLNNEIYDICMVYMANFMRAALGRRLAPATQLPSINKYTFPKNGKNFYDFIFCRKTQNYSNAPPPPLLHIFIALCKSNMKQQGCAEAIISFSNENFENFVNEVKYSQLLKAYMKIEIQPQRFIITKLETQFRDNPADKNIHKNLYMQIFLSTLYTHIVEKTAYYGFVLVTS